VNIFSCTLSKTSAMCTIFNKNLLIARALEWWRVGGLTFLT